MNAKNVQLQLAPEDYLIITVSTSRNNFTSFLQLAAIEELYSSLTVESPPALL